MYEYTYELFKKKIGESFLELICFIFYLSFKILEK